MANVPEAFDIDMEEYLGLGDTNAARIVACVNAFHGREIPTEKITEGLFWEMRLRLEKDASLFEALAKQLIALPATDASATAIRAILAKLED